MPTYTFCCPKCKHKFTDFFPMDQADGENIVCPKCKTKGLKRVWEGSFFIGGNSKKGSESKSSCPACSLGSCGLNR